MPGRSFESPSDFNTQFTDWLERANRRVVRTIKARPIDLVDADWATMSPLPPVAPTVGWLNQIRLGQDYYVRADSNDYTVDPTASAGRSPSPPTWNESECASTAASSPTTPEYGPAR